MNISKIEGIGPVSEYKIRERRISTTQDLIVSCVEVNERNHLLTGIDQSEVRLLE